MTKELRILLLEDRPADVELVMGELRKGGLQFAGKCVATEADFLAQLRDDPPDLILADYSLPAYDGLSALASARKGRPETPFIFVSGALGEETAIEALHHGATDYVLKERLTRLVPAVQRALREIEELAQRRQAEESLRASERSYREIFDATNDAIFLYDGAAGAILDVNQTMLDMYGYSRDELLNMSGDEFRAGTAFSQWEAVRRIQQAATEGPKVFEWQSRRKDGELFWAEVALRGANIGGQRRVLAVVRDISERKREESALAENRGLLRAILDNIPDPAWLKDIQGRFLACNQPLAHIFGGRVEDILGKTLYETIPADAERLAREDQEVLATGKPIRVERQLSDALGQRRWFDTIKSPIFNKLGEVTGSVGISRETTERRQNEEALRVSEERFRSVWEHSIDGMCLMDGEGRILAVNEAFCLLVKLPWEKLIGEVFSVAYAGHGPDEGIEAYRRCFEAGTIAPRLTTHLRLWNSEELNVELSSSFLGSSLQGRTLLSVFRDVGERKRAERRLAAFSQLGEKLSAAKTVREAAEIIVEVADQLLGWDACSLDLYSSKEKLMDQVLNRDTVDGRRIEGSPGYVHLPPSPLARRVIEEGGQLILKEKPDQMAPGGMPFGNEARPSASILFVPARAGAEVVGVLSIHSYTPKAYDQRGLDTLQMLADHCAGALKRIRAQEALSASEANYRSLVENIPQKIFVKDRNLRWVSVNANFAGELGLRPEEIVGKTDYDFFPKELADKYRADDERIMRTGQTEELEEKHFQGGREIWVNVVKTPVRNERGEITGVFGIFWDISERMKLEQQLRQSQKMEAIGQLAGGVAHDFNNMLAVIGGNAELLLMDADQHTPATNEGLKQITAATARAANLTRQLLAFSRKQVMQSEPLVLNKVVADLTKMLKRIIGEHIDLECRYAAQLPFVRADAGMMEQVLLNLAINARDAMPRGGHLLIATDTASFDAAHAHAHPGAGAGEFVRLTVTDNGTGIASEHLPRIFEPFFTTKELGKGTGLGLATVYGIVQQHQGWVEVSSQPGAGATFKIFLPVIPSPAGAAAAVKAETKVPGGGETILLVEDEYAVRSITRRVLESQGYRIYEATTVREALEVWRGHAEEIELLLTDIVMPQGLTGRELSERLRAQRPALKVIFMSGYSSDVIGKDTGFFRRTKSSFLQKPISTQALLQTVRRCLDDK